jgi:hypothetical protein
MTSVEDRIRIDADSNLSTAVRRVVAIGDVAALRVAASAVEPDRFGLPVEGSTIEQILNSRFRVLSPDVRQAAGVRAVVALAGPDESQSVERRALAGLDLSSVVGIEALADHAYRVLDAEPGPGGPPAKVIRTEIPWVPSQDRVVPRRLVFEVHSVACVEETDGGGYDEIQLGATVAQLGGVVAPVESFRVSNRFAAGKVVPFDPPRVLASFTPAAEGPQAFLVTLVLGEIDNGGFDEFVEKVVRWAAEALAKELAEIVAREAITRGVGAAVGAAAGGLFGAALGFLVGLLIDAIVSAWKDDMFAPAPLYTLLPWPAGVPETSLGQVTFSGHGGIYTLQYQWRLEVEVIPAPPRPGPIYGIRPREIDPRTGQRRGGDLRWFRHDGGLDGANRWITGSGKRVGTGWHEFPTAFAGSDGAVYAVTERRLDPVSGARSGGELWWWRHDGREDGTVRWSEKKRVGTGWHEFKQVFAASDGVIYAVRNNGNLLWYRHDGRHDGTFAWAPRSGERIDTDWDFEHVMAGRDGVIYAVRPRRFDARTSTWVGGGLFWFKHDGHGDGTARWASGSGKQIGHGWQDFVHVFGGVHGVIYGVSSSGDLYWYRHDGADRWAPNSGTIVDSDWFFTRVLAAH